MKGSMVDDVTDRVIASSGVFTLRPGQTVDFKRVADAMFRWRESHDDITAADAHVRLVLLSGSVAFEVDGLWLADGNGSWKLDDWSTNPLQYAVYFTGLSCLAEEISPFDLNPVSSPIPELLSTELVVLESDYGKSYLTGIAIEYFGVDENDRMR